MRKHDCGFGSDGRGVTLSELLIVVTLIGILAGFSLPSLLRGYDRLEAQSAAQETITAFFVGRETAIAAGQPADIVIDAPHGGLWVVSGGDTVFALSVGVRHGVEVAATRQSMTYTATGLGYGGANLRVILSRGTAAETVFVSREGRAKHGAQAQ